MTFGERLRMLRQQYDMKQKDLAIILGLSSDAISKLERGERNPTSETLQKLSSKEVFDVSVDYLLCKTDIPTNEIEQTIINNINDDIENMDKVIDVFAEKHGILFDDGKRYTKEELEKIIKHYLKMVNAFKDLNS